MAAKGLAFMVGALVVLTVPTVIYYTQGRDQWSADEDPRAGQLALPTLERAVDVDLGAIELVDRDGTLRVERRGGRWVLPAKDDYPARSERVLEFVRGLQTLRLVEASTANRDKFDRIGLVAPGDGGEESTLVRVLGAQDAVLAELLLGRPAEERSAARLYVRRPDESQTWLAAGDVPRSTSASAWFDAQLARVDSQRIRSAAVVFPERGDVGYQLERADPSGFGFQFSPLPEGRELAEEWKYTALARLLGFLSFEDVRSAATFDTTGAERAKVVYTTHDGLVVELDACRLPSAVDGVSGPVWIALAARSEPVPAGPVPDGQLPPDPAAVEAEAKALGARAAGWWFKLSAANGATLFTVRDDLLKPLAPLPALPRIETDGETAAETPAEAPVEPGADDPATSDDPQEPANDTPPSGGG